MFKLQCPILLIFCYQIIWATASSQYIKLCVTQGFEKQCDQLERESPEVKCVRVQDSVECARLLRRGTTGLGIFSAESMLLLSALQYDKLIVLKELRHIERRNHTSDSDSVVVVRASHANGIEGLKGLNYCHPGLHYEHTDRWTERFLKQFERSVTTPRCENATNTLVSQAEIEVAALADVFGAACRPGAWSNNPEEDKKLKAKYPKLCELCPNNCEYDTASNRHIEAMKCLVKEGHVAYVSFKDARDFFLNSTMDLRSQYAYLCKDGKVEIMNDDPNIKPCTWLSQPWPAIVASENNVIELSNKLDKWATSSYGWENAVREIITADSMVLTATTIQTPRSVFQPYREVPFYSPLCSTAVTWCTKSLDEKEKCEVIRMAGITTGVYPVIECKEPVNQNSIGCIKEVNEGRADFTVIDSNFGYIARRVFNLTTALYGETEKHASAGILVRANSTFKSLENLRGSRACISEFNGIASVAFINNGKKIGLLPNKCNHSELLGDFFGQSCAPGATDSAHDFDSVRENLCSLCPHTRSGGISAVQSVAPAHSEQSSSYKPLDLEAFTAGTNLQNELDDLNSKVNCNADQYNSFHGDRGALFCLLNRGDVAILGLHNLKEHAKSLTLDPNYYQIMCRNGSRAEYTGFDVDPDCTLSHFINSEVVIQPDNMQRDGIINALLSFDKYFKNDPYVKIYGTFDGYMDVLFNNGTIEMVAYNEDDLGASVDNYNNLLKETTTCGGSFITSSFASLIVSIILILNGLRQ